MKQIMIAVLFLVGLVSMAPAEMVVPQNSVKGINESVTIRRIEPGVWGYNYEGTGFSSGTGTVSLIPVTREAAQVLQGLNKDAAYNCVIENSTYITLDTLNKAYYVLDINCD